MIETRSFLTHGVRIAISTIGLGLILTASGRAQDQAKGPTKPFDRSAAASTRSLPAPNAPAEKTPGKTAGKITTPDGRSKVRDAAPRVAAPRRRLSIGLDDAVRLATLNNSSLRARYYDHLLERSRIEEAKGAFDPVFFAEGSAGTNEVQFPQTFPTGDVGPGGEPTFFQTIVTDSSDVASLQAGVRGKFRTGATYELSMNTDFLDREDGGLINPSWNTRTTATLTQPILRSAWEQFNLAEITQARYTEAQSRQRYRLEVLQRTLDVQRAYWEFVFSVQDLEVRKQSLNRAEKLLEINRVKVETGVFAPIEIASAESEVANRVTDVLVGENTVKDREDALRRVILAFDTMDDWHIELKARDLAKEIIVPIPPLESCIETALAERPDLAEQRLGLRNRAIAVATADTETLPKLDLTGRATWTGLGEQAIDTIPDSFGSRGAETWSVGLSFELPIGNKAARSRLAQRRIERDRAILEYRDMRISRVEEVRLAYRKVRLAEKTIVSRKRAAELKQKELSNEQIKLENKVSTNFQVTQVQEDLALRQSELIRALVDHRVALAELAFAMGSSPQVLNWPVTAP